MVKYTEFLKKSWFWGRKRLSFWNRVPLKHQTSSLSTADLNYDVCRSAYDHIDSDGCTKEVTTYIQNDARTVDYIWYSNHDNTPQNCAHGHSCDPYCRFIFYCRKSKILFTAWKTIFDIPDLILNVWIWISSASVQGTLHQDQRLRAISIMRPGRTRCTRVKLFMQQNLVVSKKPDTILWNFLGNSTDTKPWKFDSNSYPPIEASNASVSVARLISLYAGAVVVPIIIRLSTS